MVAAEEKDLRLAQEHAAAFLRLAALCLLFGSIVYFAVLLLGVPGQRMRLAGPAFLVLVCALALYCHHCGKIRPGLLVLGFGLWAEITLLSIITGGVQAPALYLYPLIILMAGWLLNRQLALVFALLSITAIVGLAVAESSTLLPQANNRPVLHVLVQSGTLIFVSIILGHIVSGYQARLEEVKRLTSNLDQQVTALAASDASFRDLFNSVNEAIYIQDRAGLFLDVNEGVVRMYGHPRESFIGRSPEFVSAPGRNDLARVGSMVEKAFAGEPQRFEFWGLRANGEAFPKEVRLVRGSWRGQGVVYATADDITERRRAEEELRASESKFQQVFMASPVAIAITRLEDGRYIDINDAFVDLFGWSREEAIGRSSVEMGKWIRPEDRQDWSNELKRRGRVANHEIELRNKRGETLNVLFSAETIMLGREPCALVLSIDQTVRKQAETALLESRQKLAEAQRIGRVGSWDLDLPSGRMTWSEEVHRIYQNQPGAFSGTFDDLLKMVPPEDRDAVKDAYLDVSERDSPCEIKHRILTPGGRVKWIRASRELSFDAAGRPLRALGTAQDITEQEEARAEIQRLNSDLELRVQQRTAELMASNRELESFAYSISHDLRTPLRGIDGFSHLLAEEYGDRLDAQGRSYIERVRSAAQRMGSLIDDILHLARITRQEMRWKMVDLSRLAAESIQEISRASPGRNMEISIAQGCMAHGDPQLLREALQSLLENAWKYSHKNPQARIEFGSETIDGKLVYFVRDNGVGFDSQYAGRMFAPFQRLHSPEEFGGNGIGLATVARIVSRHGGRVWADAMPGEGATFRFTLG